MLAQTLLNEAREGCHVIATAESCTGGLVAGEITSVAGSSDIFDRAFVTYTNRAKAQMLGVQTETLQEFGAVSEQVAKEMAAGALARSQATIAVSITGIAGPGGSGTKPEGRVCFGLAWANGLRTETVDFGALGRDRVRVASVDHALQMILHSIRHDAHESLAKRRICAQELRSL
ncbi:CinA family protein [Nioella aestuarii]|uniref:CinA family protein n=1 Tax=Nioella aestuarii TaxID=1662864 RepID=UPI003D7FC514